jgi:hypothetical protein
MLLQKYGFLLPPTFLSEMQKLELLCASVTQQGSGEKVTWAD